jgi:hypothetical protein
MYELRPIENYNSSLNIWGSRYVLHRIVNKTFDGNYIFQGDNNRLKDDLIVKPAQIVFVITKVEFGTNKFYFDDFN